MKRGYGYIAIAVVMFTSFEVVLKFIAGQINPVQLTLCRFSIGFLFLLPVALHTLRKREQRLDRGEFLDVVPVPLDQAVEMVLSGEISDAKTQVGILLLARRAAGVTPYPPPVGA